MTIYVSRAARDGARCDRGRAGKRLEINSYADLIKHADDTIERAIRFPAGARESRHGACLLPKA